MRYTTTVVLALLVLAVAVLIFVFRDRLAGEPKGPEKAAEAQPLLKDVTAIDVSAATLEETGPGGKSSTRAAFTREGGQWRMTAPVDYPANPMEVDRLVHGMTDAKYRQDFEAGAKGKPTLAAIGLQPAAYRLILTIPAKDKTPERSVALSIGQHTAIGEGLYIRLGDAPKVIVLDKSELLTLAREKPDAYRSHDLVSAGRDEIGRIDVTSSAGTAELERAADDRSRWVLSRPTVGRADPDAVSGIIRSALGLQVKDFISDDPKDLATYGLDKPAVSVTLWKEAAPAAPAVTHVTKNDRAPAPAEPVKVATFRFGGPADPQKLTTFLLTDDGKHVVTVDSAAVKNLDKTPQALRDKHVMAVDPLRITRIQLKLPAKLTVRGAAAEFELVKAAGGWNVVSAGRTDKADPAAVDGLLRELTNLRVLYLAEGETAEVAKKFEPAGSVRLTVEGAAAPVGFEIGSTPALVKNLHEDWVGFINDLGLVFLRKDWLDYLGTQVLAVNEKSVTGLAIQTPDRKEVFAKAGDQWKLTAPTESEAEGGLVPEILKALQALRCERYTAATKDYKPYGLETGQVVVTATLAAAKAGEPTTEKVLRLARDDKGKVFGRTDGSDMVFEVSPEVFSLLVAEPVERHMTAVSEFDINRIDVTAGSDSLVLVKTDNKWFRADAAGRPTDEVSADAAREFVAAATDLEAARWAAYDAKEIARFGLDKPAVRIKLTGDRSTTIILVSDKEVPADVAGLLDQKPVRYAMVEGGPRIGIIAGRSAELLTGAIRTFEPKKEPAKAEEPKPAATATAPTK